MDASSPPPAPPPPPSLPSSSISTPSSSLPSSVNLPSSQRTRTIPLLSTELKREILRFCDPSTLAKTSTLSLALFQLSSPLLSTELKREILRFCDPSTLAKTSTLSLALFQLSSPLLYNDVAITGFQTVAKLFRKRDARHQPQLEPYLSLAQIRTLSITIELGESYPDHPPHFSPDRLSSSRLPLFSLSLVLPITPVVGSRNPRAHKSQWSSLLPLLDPIHVLLQGNLYTAGFDNWWSPCIRIVGSWRNLRVLTVEDCSCVGMDEWECLSRDGEAVKVVLRSHPTTEAEIYTSDLLYDGNVFDVENSRVSEVVVQFSDLGTRSYWADFYCNVMDDLWGNEGLPTSEIDRRLAMVRYEVV